MTASDISIEYSSWVALIYSGEGRWYPKDEVWSVVQI